MSPPRAVFETDEDRLAFLVTIPVHEGYEKRLSSGISSCISSCITSKSVKTEKKLRGISVVLGVSQRSIDGPRIKAAISTKK